MSYFISSLIQGPRSICVTRAKTERLNLLNNVRKCHYDEFINALWICIYPGSYSIMSGGHHICHLSQGVTLQFIKSSSNCIQYQCDIPSNCSLDEILPIFSKCSFRITMAFYWCHWLFKINIHADHNMIIQNASILDIGHLAVAILCMMAIMFLIFHLDCMGLILFQLACC